MWTAIGQPGSAQSRFQLLQVLGPFAVQGGQQRCPRSWASVEGHPSLANNGASSYYLSCTIPLYCCFSCWVLKVHKNKYSTYTSFLEVPAIDLPSDSARSSSCCGRRSRVLKLTDSSWRSKVRLVIPSAIYLFFPFDSRPQCSFDSPVSSIFIQNMRNLDIYSRYK